MASARPDVDEATQRFIEQQPMFFVASAPLSGDGHINLSPKGLGTLRVLSPTRVAYLDLGGSGNETSAHVLENGRLAIMFCSFGPSPRILRLFGRGRVVVPSDSDWAQEYARFGWCPGARQIVILDVRRVQSSCGYGVPLMEVAGQRALLADKRAAAQGWYCPEGNLRSLDGLPTHLARPTEASTAP